MIFYYHLASDLTAICSVRLYYAISCILTSDIASKLALGWRLGFWLMGLIVNLVNRWLSLPNLLFWGCNYSGRSDLSTKGGSLNYKFLKNHFFQSSRGSTTGSSNTFFGFVKKSLTLSGYISFWRASIRIA